MKRTLLICLFLLLIPLTAQAQKTLQDAAQATGNGSDLVINVGAQQTNGVTAQISGTFSGTITWRATVDGTNFIDVQGTNLTTGVTTTTATATGLYSFLLPRVSTFRAVITTYSSGSITVVAAAAVGVARVYSEGSGGGVSQVTGVDTNGFTFSIANPTTTPAITLTMQNAAADGATKGVAGFTAVDFDAAAGIISIDYTNAQKATSSVPGFLSAADWSTFNGKQASLGFTAENVANKDTDGTLAANSDTKYASQKATKTYADTKAVSTRNINTTSPITGGGDLSADRTIACAICVIASSPGAGIAHFAGSTQTVTSSLIVNADITNSTIDLTAKVTGLLPAANIGVNVLDQSVYYAADAGSNDTYVITLSPVPAGYVTGGHYRFKANTANTGAATININSLGAKTIKKAAGGITTDLADNDILSGQFVDVVYDGTNMQMQSTLGNAASGSGTTINSTNAVIPQRSNPTTFIDSPITGSVPGSMVDGITVTGAATANPATVTMAATGSDSNINIAVNAKGTGEVVLGSTTVAFGGYLNTVPGLTATGNELYTTNGQGGCCTGFRTNTLSFINNNPSTITTVIDGTNSSRNLTKYMNVTTAGWGLPAIYAAGRVTAQSAANSSIATYTVGAADSSFEVSANMNVTAATVLATTLVVTYTDESNTARTMILPIQQLSGSFISGGAITGTGAWESPAMHIRCKAGTVITILTTTGTFTGVTYTAEGIIKQTA